MILSENPDVDFARYDRQQEQEMAQLRRCEDCGKAIQDDYFYDVDGEILCEKCMEKRYRRLND